MRAVDGLAIPSGERAVNKASRIVLVGKFPQAFKFCLFAHLVTLNRSAPYRRGHAMHAAQSPRAGFEPAASTPYWRGALPLSYQDESAQQMSCVQFTSPGLSGRPAGAGNGVLQRPGRDFRLAIAEQGGSRAMQSTCLYQGVSAISSGAWPVSLCKFRRSYPDHGVAKAQPLNLDIGTDGRIRTRSAQFWRPAGYHYNTSMCH